MSLAEVLPSARKLSSVEKLRLIQLLAEELASAQEVPELEAGKTYPVWSPHDAYQAAEILFQMLEKEKTQLCLY